MTKDYQIVFIHTIGYLLDLEAPINIGDYYYTSLEHSIPYITKCRSINKNKEYWLDNDLKYQMNYNNETKKALYGSAKIVGSSDKSLLLPLINISDIQLDESKNNSSVIVNSETYSKILKSFHNIV